MKKKTCLGLLAALLALCLAACSESDPLAAAQKNIQKASSMDAKMVMTMDMEVVGETLETVTTMETSVFTNPSRLKLDMSMDMGVLGSLSAVLYAEESGEGTYAMYTYDGQQWHSETAAASQLEEYDFSGDMDYYIASASNLTQEGVEKIGGVSAYKYTGSISGDAMREVMLKSGALDSLTANMNMDQETLSEMLDGLDDIAVALWIGEEELYPLQFHMDMTSVINGLMSRLLEDMGSQSGGEAFRVSQMSVTLTYSNFNNATDFTIPQEALA